jgi:Putative metal-binding motif
VDPGTKRVTVFARISRTDRRLKRVAIIAFVSGLLLVSGIAVAEWLANGSGSGYAKAANAQNLTTSTAVASGTLYPGGTGDMALSVNNPNPYPVTVTSVVGAGPIVSSSPACNANGHGVSFTNQTGLSLVVPAQGSASFVLADSVTMAESSANECQGATFEIPVALTGVSGASGGGDPVDADLDGSASVATGGTDCDDTNAAVHPGAAETANGIDDDCDGAIDDGIGQITGYADLDLDGFGAGPGLSLSALQLGFAANNSDCDDFASAVHPGAAEVQNGLDDDCDGTADEGFVLITGYPDVDGDGHGDFLADQQIFLTLPAGFVESHDDCNDADEMINPDMEEVLNGIDDDCDGLIDDDPIGG